MAKYDVSSQRASLLSDATTVAYLPPELLQIIRSQNPANLLDALAQAALIPRLTGRIFAHFEPLFADICARWLLNTQQGNRDDSIIAAFARVLPFAPQLSGFLDDYLKNPTSARDSQAHSIPPLDLSKATQDLTGETLLRTLLAAWRLLNFDRKAYACLLLLDKVQDLFAHPHGPVKYLAIRIFCLLLNASDSKLEALVQHHIPQEDALTGDFDGKPIDFVFLSLLEHIRAEDIHRHVLAVREQVHVAPQAHLPPQNLTPLAVNYGNTILPRPRGPPSKPSSLVTTPTTLRNLEYLARLLQEPGPILLHGASGAGKTALVMELAQELGMDDSLVTLHLNEQTDAKMLIGLYTTGTKPGSFEWRPGILTTAVREGRWVLIEDLDRAPTEVMSTLLPLIERGELLIPNRGERIQAPGSFRILATVRTSRGMNGQENIPSLLGLRFWQMLPVQNMDHDELQTVIHDKYPLLLKFVSDPILKVFDRVCVLLSGPSLVAGTSTASERPISPRDLFKWCRRLENIIAATGARTGDEPMSETAYDGMFMEAIDCFASGIKDSRVREKLILHIGEMMGRSNQRVEHHLTMHIPKLEDTETSFTVGRSRLQKVRRQTRVAKPKRPFAATTHARRLMEQIAVAVELKEPVLLVGETGIGKTTVVQQLSDSLGHRLVAVNLSQQSEVGDLLGGFKPINVRNLAVPLKEEFEDLFALTGISQQKNQKYLDSISKNIAKGRWSSVAKLWKQSPRIFADILSMKIAEEQKRDKARDEGQPAKRRKTEGSLQTLLDLKPRWEKFASNLEQFEIQLSGGSGGFAFAFVEGNIVKAVRNGDWVLLDEINLASPDTLESIADLLQSGPDAAPSILLSETGEIERIQAHSNFRIFGAMNPATDVGKRDLPLGLRSRFTELYVSSPDKDFKDLVVIVKSYLSGQNSRIDQAADKVANLYMRIKELADAKALVDGANELPHFSLRTLTRVLTYVNDVSPFYGLERSLYEGFCMGFLTHLSRASEQLVMPLIMEHLLGKNPSRTLATPPKYPNDGREYVKFMDKHNNRVYWLLKGIQDPKERADYIRTPYVERNLLNLVRATSTRRFPILIQGPTSAGKTSMIEYLAEFSGNKFVRINNHEHTDLQEYLGTYISGSDGKLKFQEGLLVQAMRHGHWIVLDELNLAPTDILEALNRLLDDNRELLIPETQEIVRPHENFMLFATQNPPGLYGGRKVLSRAFRNRFLELHYDDIPEDELEDILQKRSINTAPSDCRRIVSVYKELSRLRQTSRVFEQKDSFATLRDLFRWALREAETREDIANNGFMLLAERVRDDEERVAVRNIIETVFKVKIDPDQLYVDKFSEAKTEFGLHDNSQGVVWTNAMRRLYILVSQALCNNEPVLLVGETGCGKTTICQLLAEAAGKELAIVNAHQNTETGDLIGSQRPVRNRTAISDALKQSLVQALQQIDQSVEGSLDELLARYQSLTVEHLGQLPEALRNNIHSNEIRAKALFEWSDGSLVHAMKNAHFFLLDEISLADDSVLERLNSVLEPGRTLLLAEKGTDDSFVRAADGFQFFATMNPGGDFGKKELSPALRNRFTEIWVPPLSSRQDILDIVTDKLKPPIRPSAHIIVDFSYWFGKTCRLSTATAFSIRDILVWVNFVNHTEQMQPALALLHGASTVFIDSLGANPAALLTLDPETMEEQRQKCLDKLNELIGSGIDVTPVYRNEPQLVIGNDAVQIGDFSIARASAGEDDASFAFDAPTTKMNLMRVIRALSVNKPILLEGNPGVGKTTLVSALAKACGRPLTRINLSDQTDLMDLFGTDVPVEGAEVGNFAWRDAPFLQAMQKGEWVLLDEMNLASQSVLEGLNACLDHRGEVYISELDQVFKCHPEFKLFAAQNPHSQGGGRKGLPSSFVNRFIVVYADVFTEQDLMLIASKRYAHVPSETIEKMIRFVSSLDYETSMRKSFGSHGSPWEFNLRDSLRWLELLASRDPLFDSAQASDFLDIVVTQRFRSAVDRHHIGRLFTETFGAPPEPHSLYHHLSSAVCQVGLAMHDRNPLLQPSRFPTIEIVPRLAELESLLICAKQNLPCILVGPSGSGKTSLLRHVAASVGKELVTFPLNADVDAMDLVGGFEQADPLRELHAGLDDLSETLLELTLSQLPGAPSSAVINLLALLRSQKTEPVLTMIASGIQALAQVVPAESAVGQKMTQALDLIQGPRTLANPRFEWLDGVIVRAMRSGKWLVLDNANLCSASVLDRLNSLLERPDGFLSINEHSGADGEPRIIKPHSDFRIFLTMDPRYGELSRAMRNRSVEIYLDVNQTISEPYLARITDIESTLQRYAHTTNLVRGNSNGAVEAAILALDNLSLRDSALLSRYKQMLSNALALPHADSTQLHESLSALVSYLSSSSAATTRQSIVQMYSTLSKQLSSGEGLTSVQPLHALHNAPMIALLDKIQPNAAQWLGVCYEFLLEIQRTQQAMQAQNRISDRTKPSSLNRLQRSLVSRTVVTVAKDSTVHVADFLKSITQLIELFVDSTLSNLHSNASAKSALRALVHYWWRTFTFVANSSFEEARFQAHLKQGIDLLQAIVGQSEPSHASVLVQNVLQNIHDAFTVGFKLTTGLEMETLWQLLRQQPVADEATFSAVQEMEKLSARFDAIKWKSNASVADLGKAIAALSEAYSVVRGNATTSHDLIAALQAEVHHLEANVGDESREMTPFFEDEFEILRQALVIHKASRKSSAFADLQEEVVVLANTPTLSQMRLHGMGHSQRLLHSLDYVLGRAATSHPWSGRLMSSLLHKYDSTAAATLFSLQSLETELPAMGRLLAGSSEAVSADSVACLNGLLLHLMREIFKPLMLLDRADSVYGQLSRKLGPIAVTEHGLSFGALPCDFSGGGLPQHLNPIIDQHFLPAIIALVASEKSNTQKSSLSAVAWANFAVGCIKLYVPDKIFDPYLRAQTERDYHEELMTALKRKWQALNAFEESFTGQSSNLRSDLLRQEIEDLGEPPAAATTMYRPSSTDLVRLQGEFNNVLSAVVKSDIISTVYRQIANPTNSSEQEVQLVRDNITHLIERMTTRFAAYEDLTVPLVTILRTLQVGLSLSTVPGPLHSSDSQATWLLGVTPMLGGSLSNSETALSCQNLEFLSFVGVLVSVDGLPSLDMSLREKVAKSLHYFYEEWSKKLDTDKRQDAISSSLYRYKGSAEDEDEADQEAFNELFPDYETEDAASALPKDATHTARTLALILAERHEKIFLRPQDGQQGMISFCKAVGRKISNEAAHSAKLDAGRDRALLPTTLLVLDEKLDGFMSSLTSADYNFYISSNLFEARKLVNLVHSLRLRFKELQGIDEIAHLQPIADVLNACEHVFELSHSDPLAKIIHRVEKLHAFLYEWQHGGWASQIYGAPVIYTKLTDMIVSWRRLELGTWAKLFDQELDKCQSDAKSWWFVAYHAVIAIPLSKLELAQDLKDYAIQLIGDLEMFFTEAVLGEFSSRLQLLRQLSKQLELLAVDYKELAVIHNAVLNFLAMYRRYESKVTEAIKQGRAPIEKSMKDVLLLASWRDTNIAALRESARKSHEKLFRIVRKFRAVLGQPMRSVIESGLPNENHATVAVRAIPTLPEANEAAVAVCQQFVPGWFEDPHTKRLSNAGKIINIMSKAAQLPEASIDAVDLLDAFVTDTMSEMASLQKETPPFLNDENKEEVKHLKTRKVRLFEETVKAIRTMGFTRNLNENHLRDQKQLSAVLAKLQYLPSEGDTSLAESEYYFHKALDLAPQVRATMHDHNGDLTNETVRRCTGYMEGTLHVLVQQRQSLAQNTRTLGFLDKALASVRTLAASSQTKTLTTKRQDVNHERALRWLIPVLGFGIHLLDVHAKLGKLDNGGVRSALQEWLTKFTKLQSSFESCQAIPDKFESTTRLQLRDELEENLANFEADLQLLETERPDLAFVFEQLQLWASITINDDEAQGRIKEAGEFFEEALTLSKKVLDAVQKFQKAATSLPTSSEEPSWLLQYNDKLNGLVKSLRMDTISVGIDEAISHLSTVELTDPAVRNAALSLLSVTLPVLQQYANTCRKTVANQADLHRASSKMSLSLGKSYVEIASRGFCTPQEKSDESSGQTGNLESGVGLGDGEGAEDISKDIQPDEDLTELAQEPNKEKDGDIEDQEDAVDMGNEEMEGDLGSAAGNDDDKEDDDKDGEDEEDDMDEETGDVDDLDPTAVDEKMWEGDGDDAEKDQKGDQSKGQKKEDEQVAAEDNAEGQDADTQAQDEPDQINPEPEEEAGPDQDEAAAQEELNRQDQNVDENEALALPEEMDLDGDDAESAISDDDLDKLSDIPGDADEEANEGDEQEEVDKGDGDTAEMKQEEMEQEIDPDKPDEDMQGENAEMEDCEPEAEEQGAEEGDKDEEKPPLNPDDDAHADPDNAAPSDVKSGAAQDQAEVEGEDDQNAQSKAAQRDHGEVGQNAEDQETAAGNEGATSKQDDNQKQADEADKQGESSQAQPFKKLGDTLERWYRQHQDIKESIDEQQDERQKHDADMAQKEFQHLQNDNDAPDAQALGAAADDEVQPIDESMAIDEEEQDPASRVMPQQEDEEMKDVDQDFDEAPEDESKDRQKPEQDDTRTGVATRQGAFDRERSESPTRAMDTEQEEHIVEETSTQLSTTHISDEDRSLRDYATSLGHWTSFQTKTHPLSLVLTSQLRLILTPSQSTKLSGSYRTGKRLNIKKIIPYIASSYKRDKIWMRRAIPTKRMYQILLCVDDSRSMGETTSGTMALESLVMVARALAMLEVGQVGVLGFGADVFEAHALSAPLLNSHDMGARVLQNFTFEQDRTDIGLLIRRTIDQFRDARSMNRAGSGEDLWQLALILSDGLTPSSAHERIRRLLREALEERIMVVFIIMDDSGAKKGDSVLELKEAKFMKDGNGDSKVVIERYLDTFPFQYYLIVHNLEDLPGALAGLLRTWFAEVNS